MFKRLPDTILAYIFKFLEVPDISKIGGSCRELAFDSHELWLQVYKDHHGDALRRLGVSRVSRQQSNPRFAFFKRILDRQQYLVRLFLLLASKDFNDNVRKFVHTMEALKFSSKDINCKYQCFENSDLMCVCARFKRWRCLKYLVTLGGSLSTGGDSRGCSPLLVAAWTGNVSMVRYILTTITSLESTQCLYQEISRKGRPWSTSACGGKGPFDPETWARRKFLVCGDSCFRQAAQVISKYKRQLSQQGFDFDEGFDEQSIE